MLESSPSSPVPRRAPRTLRTIHATPPGRVLASRSFRASLAGPAPRRPRRPIVLMASSSRGGEDLAGGTQSSSPVSVASDDDGLSVESDVVAVVDPGKAGDQYIEEYCKRRRVESELRNKIKVQAGRLVSRCGGSFISVHMTKVQSRKRLRPQGAGIVVNRNTDELPHGLMKPKHWQFSAASNATHDGLDNQFTFARGLTNHCRVWREQQEDHSLQVSGVGLLMS